MSEIHDLEPLIGRCRQLVTAPRHVEEKCQGEATLDGLRSEKEVHERSIAENPMVPEASS